jgi:hypothetical protein
MALSETFKFERERIWQSVFLAYRLKKNKD